MFTSFEFEGGRRLRYDIAAIQDLENNTGKPLASIIRDLQNVGIGTLITAIWVGLKHEEPSLNPNLVRKRLEKHIAAKKPLSPLFRAVSDAIEASGVFAGEDEDEVDAARPPAATPDA